MRLRHTTTAMALALIAFGSAPAWADMEAAKAFLDAEIGDQSTLTRAEQEADGRIGTQEPEGEHEDDHADNADGGVLALEIGAGPFGNVAGDFLHPLVARILCHHGFDRDDGINDGEGTERDDSEKSCHDWTR